MDCSSEWNYTWHSIICKDFKHKKKKKNSISKEETRYSKDESWKYKIGNDVIVVHW